LSIIIYFLSDIISDNQFAVKTKNGMI
jgi:hypothetical protein